VQYLTWRLMSALLRRLPLRVAYAVAALCGSMAFFLVPRLRKTTTRNFQRVLPAASGDTVRATARASVVNYCRYLVDFARASGRQPRLPACEAGDAFARLRCLTATRGAVIVPMHFGNWDAGAAAATKAGFPLTAVADRFNDPRLDREVFGARERLGMRIVPIDSAGPAIVRPLRKGGLLALLIDKPTPGDGVAVPFFGADTHVPSGPARLALLTGAAIVPVAFPRLAGRSDRIGVLADFGIDTCPTGDPEADVYRITAAVMAAHERYLRSYPDQWYMFREMWPDGEVSG
jgi:lauroyl/myristoyl acyltransferase